MDLPLMPPGALLALPRTGQLSAVEVSPQEGDSIQPAHYQMVNGAQYGLSQNWPLNAASLNGDLLESASRLRKR